MILLLATTVNDNTLNDRTQKSMCYGDSLKTVVLVS